MTTARFEFASDNTAGIAPEALRALIDANSGAAAGYGDDIYCKRAGDLVRSLLDVDAPVYFLPTGTAANALALSAICGPHQAVAAHAASHVVTGEAGAPGFIGSGLSLLAIPGSSGRLSADALRRQAMDSFTTSRQPLVAVSLALPTEYGVMYEPSQLNDLIAVAREHELSVHIDGARLANAAAAGFDTTLPGQIGVSTLVLGGTKAGLPGSEALVLMDRRLDKHFTIRMKQSGHLMSKSRYLSAPWIGMLESGAWSVRSRHANNMARRLADALPYRPVHPVDTNAVFLKLRDGHRKRLTQTGWVHYQLADGAARFLCSWSTTPDLVDDLAAAIIAAH